MVSDYKKPIVDQLSDLAEMSKKYGIDFGIVCGEEVAPSCDSQFLLY